MHAELTDCPARVQVVRFPTSGLGLPGQESPVGVLVWCPRHGAIAGAEGGPVLEPATADERAWAWHHPTAT